MFSNNPKPAYVKAKNGKMIVKMADKTTQEFDQVEGRITSIAFHESEYQGETIKSWRIYLESGEQRAILTVGYSSSFTKSLINSLLAANLSEPISFSCYVKNDYNQPSVRQNNQIVKWKFPIEEVPKAEKVTVGTKEVTDDSKVAAWIAEKVEEINSKLKPSTPSKTEEVAEEVDLEDLPF